MKVAIFRLSIFALKELLLHAPELFLKIQQIFSKKNVTTIDLLDLLEEIEKDNYASIVTNTKLSEEQKTK